MPGKYDAENRLIVLNNEFQHEPDLAASSLIHFVIQDLLTQSGFGHAELHELVDVAVIATGLGVLQSRVTFVQKGGNFWDTTFWTEFPRPFLGLQESAYSHALAAWTRSEKDPDWISQLHPEVQRPTRKSLKFLNKTSDSFYAASTLSQNLMSQSQQQWLETAKAKGATTQVIALRALTRDPSVADAQLTTVREKLASSIDAVALHAIPMIERLELNDDSLVEELNLLIEHRDDVIRAKAMIAIAKLGQLDEFSIGVAEKMVNNPNRFVMFAGTLALSSLPIVSDAVLRVAGRGFKRALQTCDYEFVNQFVVAFNRWLDEPESYLNTLLANDQPEYLKISLETLEGIREELQAQS